LAVGKRFGYAVCVSIDPLSLDTKELHRQESEMESLDVKAGV
jgi:hypothetical protein